MIRRTITHLLDAKREFCRPEHIETRLGSDASGRLWRELIQFFCNHDISKMVVRSLMPLGHRILVEGKEWLFYGHAFRIADGELYLSYLVADLWDTNAPLRELVYFHDVVHSSSILDLFRCEAMEIHGPTRMVLALMDVGRHLYIFDAPSRASMLAKMAHGLARHHTECNLYLTVQGIFATTTEGHYLGAMPRLTLPGTPTSQAVQLATAR